MDRLRPFDFHRGTQYDDPLFHHTWTFETLFPGVSEHSSRLTIPLIKQHYENLIPHTPHRRSQCKFRPRPTRGQPNNTPLLEALQTRCAPSIKLRRAFPWKMELRVSRRKQNGGFTISASGSYFLMGNLSITSGDGITITADNVSDLNGFTISKSVEAGGSGITSPSSSGISVKMAISKAPTLTMQARILSQASILVVWCKSRHECNQCRQGPLHHRIRSSRDKRIDTFGRSVQRRLEQSRIFCRSYQHRCKELLQHSTQWRPSNSVHRA